MNYKIIYQSLIDKSKFEVRVKKTGDGLERHHIIPKALGGSNLADNLVLFTCREHLVAHKLLIKIYTGKSKAKMVYALASMLRTNKNQSERIRNSREYEYLKLQYIKYCTGPLHPSYGKNPFNVETLKTLSEQKKGKNNPAFGKIPWNKGKKGSTPGWNKGLPKELNPLTNRPRLEKTKEKISVALTNKPKSESHKEALSKSLSGRPRSKEASKKTGDALRGKSQDKISCPHCSKEGGKVAMFRWHLDNCKYR